MGYEYGDAQNIAVRCFLYQFSKNLNFFIDKQYKEITLKYFNYMCPYTGEKLTEDNMVKDHIIPINKEACGLHVFGNILFVTKEANNRKSSRSLDEYLSHSPEKLDIIKKFVLESGYQNIKSQYTEYLQKVCRDLYLEIGDLIKDKQNNFLKQINIVSQNMFDSSLTLNKFPSSQFHCKENNQNFIRKYSFQQNVNNKKIQEIAKSPKTTICKTINNSLTKKQIEEVCNKNNFAIQGNYTKASKNSAQDTYWANPNIKYLQNNWTLILDDYYNNTLYCFFIPANSINENQVKVRNDKPTRIDLQINYNDYSFTDSRSHIPFKKWLVKKIEY